MRTSAVARFIRYFFAYYNHHYVISCPMVAPPNLAASTLSTASGWEPILRVVLGSVGSTITKSMYGKALEDFFTWRDQQGAPGLTKATVQAHRAYLESLGYAPATVNQRLSAIRKFAAEAANLDLLPLDQAVAICRLPNVRKTGSQPGHSLSKQQSEELINAPDAGTTKGKRDRVLLALLVGCAMRRSEAVSLDVEDIQQEGGRLVFIRVVGNRGRIRSVSVPDWVEEAIAHWRSAAHLERGPLLRSVSRRGEIASGRLSPQSVFNIVQHYGRQIAVTVCPEDLRRTCAKLSRPDEGPLAEIQMLLGHASLASTERYLGDRPKLAPSANGRVQLSWKRAS